jgi:LuxR family transcriptional regulator, transcriptional regulator of spore coat protein
MRSVIADPSRAADLLFKHLAGFSPSTARDSDLPHLGHVPEPEQGERRLKSSSHQPDPLFGPQWAARTEWLDRLRSGAVGRDDLILDLRERALVALLVAGCTDASAGRRLHVSQRTVSNMLRSLMDRFGVTNRFQLGLALGMCCADQILTEPVDQILAETTGPPVHEVHPGQPPVPFEQLLAVGRLPPNLLQRVS